MLRDIVFLILFTANAGVSIAGIVVVILARI